MSEIILYKKCEIVEGKNFVLTNPTSGTSSITSYLNGLDATQKLSFNDAQYIKNANQLDLTINVVLTQSNLDLVNNNYNYAAIKNGSGWFYYFVRNIEWCGTGGVKITLHMDVLNTYQDKYKLSDKTTVQRQHKDRFKYTPAYPRQVLAQFHSLSTFEWGVAGNYKMGVKKIQFNFNPSGRKIDAVQIIDAGGGIPADIYEYEAISEDGIVEVRAFVDLNDPTPTTTIQIIADAYATSKLVDGTRLIDDEPEGIDAPLFNVGETTIKATDDNDSCYLIYKAHNGYNVSSDQNDGDKFLYKNPVDVFYAKNNKLTLMGRNSIYINVSDLTSNKLYFVVWPVVAGERQMHNSFAVDNPNPKNGDGYYLFGLTSEVTSGQTVSDVKIMRKTKIERVNAKRQKQLAVVLNKMTLDGETFIRVRYVQLARNNYVDEVVYDNGTPDGYHPKCIIFEGVTNLETFHTSLTTNPFIGGQNWNYYLIRKEETPSTHFTRLCAVAANTSKAYTDINDTDQQLIKIIKYPYDVYKNQWVFNEEELTYNSTEQLWKIDTSKLKSKLLDDIYISDTSGYNTFDNIFKTTLPTSITGNETRDNKYESKLYNSDFYKRSFVYDSFTYDIKPEFIDEFKYDINNPIKMVVPTSVTSAFLFDFKNLLTYKKSMQNYPTILCINRNNEMPIYNNYYLNYLRSGALNADAKANQQNKVASGIGIGLGVASTVAGVAMAATGWGAAPGAAAAATGIAGVTKAAATGVSMAVTGALSTAGSIAGAINSSVAADRAIQQKQAQAQQQSAAVSGADDVGLLTYYADGNHAKWVDWKVSDNTYERISDLFYYCGYACNYQTTPNVLSRYWFNYLQCTPDFKPTNETGYMPVNVKNELINKYQQGVTFLHKQNNTYDFAQTKENWEVGLI